jgi:hypothetical protein
MVQRLGGSIMREGCSLVRAKGSVMEFLSGLMIGLALGTFAVSLLLYMVWLFSAPVNRWPAPGKGHVSVEQEEEGSVQYQWINLTGEEQP